ncbi:MAG: sugar phosphate isomerase/epimerase [Akkermansiaceae bacterium]|nr:sugar phosphate isomerase/epimerase [Akkermansiaceae bacterium]
MLAFSTCWNNSRHIDGEAMIAEILELGFRHIELSHGMTVAKLPGIRKAFQNDGFSCAGVHNYFPSPVEVMIDAPDAYEFTSHRPADRQRAMDMTFKTLDIAAEFGARYLVLHMGSVPLRPAKWTRPLTEMTRDGLGHTADYARAKLNFVKKREKIAPLYYQRAISALETIAERAAQAGVKLAIESRSRYEDVPSEREMVRLQEQGKVRHDVEWPARDHRVPFSGMIDSQSVLRYFPPELPLTWELSPTREAADIVAALAKWKTEFPEFAP